MRRLPVYLLLDTSGSMYGEPIEAAKNAQFTETDALIMGKLYRRSNNWKFAAIGDAYRDNNDLRKTIKRIIENYSK